MADSRNKYTYRDYDGEMVVIANVRDTVTLETKGEGGVYFGGTDAVLRTALALLDRRGVEDSNELDIAKQMLRKLIHQNENEHKHKIGDTVYDEEGVKGVVLDYHDDGRYSVLYENCGIGLPAAEHEIFTD